MLGFGIALAVVASIPGVIAARHRPRRRQIYRLAIAAVLDAIFGAVANADPQLKQVFKLCRQEF